MSPRLADATDPRSLTASSPSEAALACQGCRWSTCARWSTSSVVKSRGIFRTGVKQLRPLALACNEGRSASHETGTASLLRILSAHKTVKTLRHPDVVTVLVPHLSTRILCTFQVPSTRKLDSLFDHLHVAVLALSCQETVAVLIFDILLLPHLLHVIPNR